MPRFVLLDLRGRLDEEDDEDGVGVEGDVGVVGGMHRDDEEEVEDDEGARGRGDDGNGNGNDDVDDDDDDVAAAGVDNEGDDVDDDAAADIVNAEADDDVECVGTTWFNVGVETEMAVEVEEGEGGLRW
ncbi:hypothetical protein HDU97_008122 [Phlyctochytrium planicorne]|nr:hypothetical protein HDU97_008122 [Phlyctochytrium planicorne]